MAVAARGSRRGGSWAQRAVLGSAALLFALPIVDFVAPHAALRPGGAEGQREARRVASASWSDGTRARTLEDHLRRRSRVRHELGGRYGFFLYRAGFVEERLVVGTTGWLYLRDRLRPRPRSIESIVRTPAALLSAISRRLASRNTALQVVVVPRKSHIAPDGLPDGVVFRPALYQALQQQLDSRGVSTTDLEQTLSALGPSAFYKLDSHWTDRGAQAAAEAVCADLGFQPTDAPRRTILDLEGTLERFDLLTLAGIIVPTGVTVDDVERDRWVLRTRRGAALDPLDNFLVRPRDSTDRPSWLLVGTSYSDGTFFPAALAHCGDRPLGNHAIGGIGPIAPLRQLDMSHPAPVQIVLEIPAHTVFSHALPQAGDWLAETPPARAVVHLGPVHRLGKKELGSRSEVLFVSNREVAHTGNGTAALRLRGRLNHPVQLVIRTGSMRYFAVWDPASTEIVLPVLADGASERLEVLARPWRGSRALIRKLKVRWVAEVDTARTEPLSTRVDTAGVLSVWSPGRVVPERAALRVDCSEPLALSHLQAVDGTDIPKISLRGGQAATWIVELDALRDRRVDSLSLVPAGSSTRSGAPDCETQLLQGPVASGLAPRKAKPVQQTRRIGRGSLS